MFFCGSSCAPTSNNLYLAECLASGVDLPLGKYLLGSFYHLMDQVSRNLLENKPIGTINWPWWLLQLWLNLYMHKMVVVDLRNLSFPSSNYSEDQEKSLDQEQRFRGCSSFGEAASVISIPLDIGEFFKRFYKGFSTDSLTWFTYSPVDEFMNPYKFSFESACRDPSSMAIFQCSIKPGLLPTEFRHGREKPLTSYEFYNQVVAAW